MTAALDRATLSSRSGARAVLESVLSFRQSAKPEERESLLLSIIALCEAQPPAPEAAPVLTDIFLALADETERQIRRTLASNLALAEWAPRGLLDVLVLDDIEVARPIIALSPLLYDQDLIRILVRATLEHQIEVARRPYLSAAVVEAVIDKGDPAPLTALASNRTARITQDDMRRLIETSRDVAALRAPLTRHPLLNEAFARRMYEWVGQSLREAIGQRFPIADLKLASAIDEAVDQTLERSEALRDLLSPPNGAAPSERQRMEHQLVQKLKAADQLRAGLLIRAVRERRLDLFEAALAALGDFEIAHIRQAIRSSSAEPLYLACSAVGIDRAVFPALLKDIRIMTGGMPGNAGSPAWAVDSRSPLAAQRAFRAAMSALYDASV